MTLRPPEELSPTEVARNAPRDISTTTGWWAVKRNDKRSQPAVDPIRGRTRVHESVCYDLLNSLRALYNPRSYTATRGWAAATKKEMPHDLYEAGRFFFQGHDTSVGYGVVRLIADMPQRATPRALTATIRAMEPRTLALHLLNAGGDTPPDSMAAFRAILDGDSSPQSAAQAVEGFTPVRKRRYTEILAKPSKIQADLAQLLDRYHKTLFAEQVSQLEQVMAVSAKTARERLDSFPINEVIEQLTGGYALSLDWPVEHIVLAPSVFIHPFVSIRVDDQTGMTLVVYGVQSDLPDSYDTVPLDPSLLQALKAMSDPARLRILRILSINPIAGPQLIEMTGLSQPTVHHHLGVLRAAGLVRQERTRNGMLLTLRKDGVAQTLSGLAAVFESDS